MQLLQTISPDQFWKTYRIKNVIFHKDSTKVILTTHAQMFFICDTSSDMKILSTYFDAHRGPIRGVDILPSSSYAQYIAANEQQSPAADDDSFIFATAGDDCDIFIWKYPSLKPISRRALQHDDYIRCVQFHPDPTTTTIGGGGAIQKSSSSSSSSSSRIVLHYLLLSAGDDMSVKLWNWQTGACLHRIAPTTYHKHYVMQAKFHPRMNQYLFSVGLDGIINVWEMIYATRETQGNDDASVIIQVKQLANYSSTIDKFDCADFHPTEDILAVGGDDSKLLLFDVNFSRGTMEQKCQSLIGHEDDVTVVKFPVENPLLLLSAGEDGKLIFWNWKTAVPLLVLATAAPSSQPYQRLVSCAEVTESIPRIWAIDSSAGRLAVGTDIGGFFLSDNICLHQASPNFSTPNFFTECSANLSRSSSEQSCQNLALDWKLSKNIHVTKKSKLEVPSGYVYDEETQTYHWTFSHHRRILAMFFSLLFLMGILLIPEIQWLEELGNHTTSANVWVICFNFAGIFGFNGLLIGVMAVVVSLLQWESRISLTREKQGIQLRCAERGLWNFCGLKWKWHQSSMLIKPNLMRPCIGGIPGARTLKVMGWWRFIKNCLSGILGCNEVSVHFHGQPQHFGTLEIKAGHSLFPPEALRLVELIDISTGKDILQTKKNQSGQQKTNGEEGEKQDPVEEKTGLLTNDDEVVSMNNRSKDTENEKSVINISVSQRGKSNCSAIRIPLGTVGLSDGGKAREWRWLFTQLQMEYDS